METTFRNGTLKIIHTRLRAKAGFVIFFFCYNSFLRKSTANIGFLFGDIIIKGYSMNLSFIDLYFICAIWMYYTDLVKR